MSEIRNYLLATLERVADGGDVTTDELSAAIPDPLALDRAERDAWEELSRWADDEDIRTEDPAYGAFKREWMRDHLVALHRTAKKTPDIRRAVAPIMFCWSILSTALTIFISGWRDGAIIDVFKPATHHSGIVSYFITMAVIFLPFLFFSVKAIAVISHNFKSPAKDFNQ